MFATDDATNWLYEVKEELVETVVVPKLNGSWIRPILLKSLSVGKSPPPSLNSNLEFTMI